MRRRAGRTGVVGHLGRRGVDHQDGDHGQRGDDDPQHAVAREKTGPLPFGRSRGIARRIAPESLPFPGIPGGAAVVPRRIAGRGGGLPFVVCVLLAAFHSPGGVMRSPRPTA